MYGRRDIYGYERYALSPGNKISYGYMDRSGIYGQNPYANVNPYSRALAPSSYMNPYDDALNIFPGRHLSR